MAKQLILCDCLGSQAIDAKALERGTGFSCSRVHTALCTREVAKAAEALSAGDAIIACGQEAERFAEIADEIGVETPLCIDIRDRAGWSDGVDASPKMAALLAEGMLAKPPVKAVDVTSDGVCLVIGPGAVALPAADKLASHLAVTVLLTDATEAEPSRIYEVIRGKLKRVQGTLGQFSLSFDGLQTLEPGGRGGFRFSPARDGAVTNCDVILDLSGGTPLFPAPEKRDGYLRADPGSPTSVADAIFAAAHHVGVFEKPLYLRLESHLCAHSRASRTGCTRCLDVCPTRAISPDGDHISVDPMVCAGCGACASLCPSGAILYDAPPVETVLVRLRTLVEAFVRAGGSDPRLLVHDDDHGRDMISLSARFGRGLPTDVIPLSVSALAGFGHAEMLAALAMGFASVAILTAPKSDLETIDREANLARAMGAEGRLEILDVVDPEAFSDALYAMERKSASPEPILPMGGRRQVARLSAKSLMGPDFGTVTLPEGAPYGAVLVDTEACTLCLSCVSLCPSGALLDNPDRPELRFQEDACLQCGICANACPEKAISLQPQFDPTDAALKQRVLNEEEPFCCIECGAAFGVKSTIEKIMEKLAGKHPMFLQEGAGRLIQMCDDCRIKSQAHGKGNPFAIGDRPAPRTTDDYLSKRRDN
ncbi:4Fe-4S binding protein [Thioclava sp. FR2]|uniref:4Fe-4S binding protein n=1 Tax=Thioclava sp. FR2 TaxID=3445780 RepID=UPI003EC14E13